MHSLAPGRDDRGVYCGPDGLFVGGAPLLDGEPIGAGTRWAPRPLEKINCDLESLYGLPVDASTKMASLAAVAKALNEGDPARACIAAVFLGLPKIPDCSAPALMKCAMALAEIGLLKAAPDDPEHPGYPAGTPEGKGGQFRPKSEFLVDLAEEEGGAHGGHAISKHVGKSPEYLIRASENSKIYAGLWKAWQDRIGSFSSLAAANKLVNSTLAQNASVVDDVAAGRIEAATIESWFNSPTGYESYKPKFESQATIRDTFGVRVRLKHDSKLERGFRIVTAFPINPEK